jgi:hypothetical protein
VGQRGPQVAGHVVQPGDRRGQVRPGELGSGPGGELGEDGGVPAAGGGDLAGERGLFGREVADDIDEAEPQRSGSAYADQSQFQQPVKQRHRVRATGLGQVGQQRLGQLDRPAVAEHRQPA